MNTDPNALTETARLYNLFQEHPVITTDTRQCPEGSLFFALRGASFNGNDFALKALEAGCAYAVVDDDSVAGDERLIHVKDVLQALQNLAAFHRHMLGTPIVQITGTNGKTTTKELTAAVLARRYRVHFTQGNFNNHIGVPKTLLQLTSEHEIAVIETGANHPGEIRDLSRIVDADCGIITNVGKAHLEGFGSFEGVVSTKAELYDYLRRKDRAFVFLDADNDVLAERAAGLATFTYGKPGTGARVEGEVADCAPFLSLRWRVDGGEWHTVQTHLIGAYNVTNALAAAAVGTHFGVAPEDITAALEAYEPTNNRSELMKTPNNTLIVDAYNANPTSMAAALENFRRIRHDHKMLILGQMGELGNASREEHQRVLSQLKQTGCKAAWLVGENFENLDESALDGIDDVQHFKDVDALKAALENAPLRGRLILVKGSNSTRLFTLPQLL